MSLWKHLRVEEACDPELVGSSGADPGAQLLVPLQEFTEPEPQRGRGPAEAQPQPRNASVEHTVQSVSQVLGHDDGPCGRRRRPQTPDPFTVKTPWHWGGNSPSMARLRSVSVLRTMLMTRCMRSTSCRRKMFIGCSGPIFCS